MKGAQPPPDSGRATLELLASEHERFAAFLRARVHDSATAEDLLQTAYARVLTSGAGPREGSRVIAWFYRVLRGTLVDHLRRKDGDESGDREADAVRGGDPALGRLRLRRSASALPSA